MQLKQRQNYRVAFLVADEDHIFTGSDPLKGLDISMCVFHSSEEVLESMLTGQYHALVVQMPYAPPSEPSAESIIYALRHSGAEKKSELPVVVIHDQLTPSLMKQLDSVGVNAYFTSHQFMTQAQVIVKGLILAAAE